LLKIEVFCDVTRCRLANSLDTVAQQPRRLASWRRKLTPGTLYSTCTNSPVALQITRKSH